MLGGTLVTVAVGLGGWAVYSFIGVPFRQFWTLRGQVVHAMNRYVRYLIGRRPLSDAELFAFATRTSAGERDEAGKEFARLGHELVTFWSNEFPARLVVQHIFRMDGLRAGRLLLTMAQDLQGYSAAEVPSRDDVLDALNVRGRE